MPKPIRYTRHAETVLIERGLAKAWVERTVYAPEWRISDPGSGDAERRFRAGTAGPRIARNLCGKSRRNPYYLRILRSPGKET